MFAASALLAGRPRSIAFGDPASSALFGGAVDSTQPGGLGPLPGRPVVHTDKDCYFPSEEVVVQLRNLGPGRLFYDWMPDFEVDSVALGTVRMILDGFQAADLVILPGDTISFPWDQRWHAIDKDGNRINPFKMVPEGEYVARVSVPLGDDPSNVTGLGQAPFIIGACNVKVSAGPDLTVDEGQSFTFQPQIDLAGANITSVAWDLDPAVDSNGDGNPRNDEDLVGATPTFAFGDDGMYSATLLVRGFFSNATGGPTKEDVVFAIDSSGSMEQNDPLGLRKDGAKDYVDLLVPDDRAAVVDFDFDAHLVNDDHLSTNYSRVKADIDTIDSFGGTFLTAGIQTSLDELQANGLLYHQWVVIFLTDAESIVEDDNILLPLQVNRAKALGVVIYTIGLNVPPDLQPLMQGIADETGGKFYPAPSADVLRGIYEDIARQTRGLRGSFFLASDTTTVTVRNVAPTVIPAAQLTPTATANLTLRVAGEKWHDVRLELEKDGLPAGNVSVVRMPGSPDDQSATLANASIFAGETTVARLVYTPADDPVNGQWNGADPAWVTVRLTNGTELRYHHTFNVQHPDTWVWDIDLSGLAVGGSAVATLSTAITDPGTDDETISIDWGDGASETRTYYNDGVGPDPRQSPGGSPVDLMDLAVHAYATAGTYTVTLTVSDDDGGTTVLTVFLVIR